jgi:hypothetical protein
MAYNAPQHQQLVRRSCDPPAAGAVVTTYVAPTAGRKSDDDLTIAKIRATLVCSTDRSVADNVYELHDGGNTSYMRMWLVCENVKDVTSPDSMSKVPAAVQHLKTSKSCVIADVACAQFAVPADRLDRAECEKVDKINAGRHEHNKLLARLLTDFAVKNGCGTSAGHITCPSRPTLYLENIGRELTSAQRDPLVVTADACTYLKTAGVLPMTDYAIQDAVKLADAVAYYRAACGKIAELMQQKQRTLHLRLPGCSPSTWDGIAETDSAGTQVRWGANETHKFWHPDVFPSYISATDPAHTLITYNQRHAYATGPEVQAFEARERFARDLQHVLATREGKAAVCKFCAGSLDVEEIARAHSQWLLSDIGGDGPISIAPTMPSPRPVVASGPPPAPVPALYPPERGMSSSYDMPRREPPSTMTTFSMSGSGVSARVSDAERDMADREFEQSEYNSGSKQPVQLSYDPSDILPPMLRMDLSMHEEERKKKERNEPSKKYK